jgi:hypothetical protein
VVEFLALRLLIRMGPVLPEVARGDGAAAVTQGLIVLGTVAQNLALLLALGLLGLIAWQKSRSGLRRSQGSGLREKSRSGLRRSQGSGLRRSQGSGLRRSQGSGLRWFLGAVVVLAVVHVVAGPAAPGWLYGAFLVAALAAMAAALWAVDCPCRRPGWLALFFAVYLLVVYPTLAATLALPLPFVAGAHTLAEIGALLAACLALPALRPRFEWRALAVAIAVAGLLAGMWFGAPWLPPTLMIWTVAFTGFLPAPLYVLALGIFVYTTLVFTLNGGRETALPPVVIGLVLVALGGLRWDFSYYVLLALPGFLLLTGTADFRKVILWDTDKHR